MSEGLSAYGRDRNPAQQGEGYSAYNVGPSSAEGKLSSGEIRNYRNAMDVLSKAPSMKKSGKIKKVKKTLFQHTAAIGTIENLRQKAASRAFDDVAKTNMQYSKPWLRKAPEGLLTEQTMDHSLANTASFGGEYQPPGSSSARGTAMAGQRTFGAVGMPQGGGSYQAAPIDMGFPAREARERATLGRGLSGYMRYQQGGQG